MNELVSLPGSDDDFDRLAAALRAESSDLATFVEVLASKLQDAFPERARVDRAGGVFRRDKPVSHIAVEIGDMRFELNRQRGSVTTRTTKVVRGIALKTDEVTMERWLDQMSQAVVSQASSSTQDRIALQRLLG